MTRYAVGAHRKAHQTIDGFTPEQRFFFGFAQVWGENMAPEEQTRRALTDPHAQGPFRVNGTVQNMPEFQKAFHCNEGQPMVREAAKRCAIWQECGRPRPLPPGVPRAAASDVAQTLLSVLVCAAHNGRGWPQAVGRQTISSHEGREFLL